MVFFSSYRVVIHSGCNWCNWFHCIFYAFSNRGQCSTQKTQAIKRFANSVWVGTIFKDLIKKIQWNELALQIFTISPDIKRNRTVASALQNVNLIFYHLVIILFIRSTRILLDYQWKFSSIIIWSKYYFNNY